MAENENKNITLISSKYKKRAKKSLSRLDRKAISAKTAIIVLLCVILPTFGYFVVFYAYTGLTTVENLTREINELENTFKSVQQLKQVYNNTIDKLVKLSKTDEIAASLDLPSQTGEYNDIKYKAEPEGMLPLVNKLFTDPGIKINSILLRSNLGFPVLPETRLESGVMLELNVNYTISRQIQ
jgi:cell division protein FtsL